MDTETKLIVWKYINKMRPRLDACQWEEFKSFYFLELERQWDKYDPSRGSLKNWIRMYLSNALKAFLRPYQKNIYFFPEMLDVGYIYNIEDTENAMIDLIDHIYEKD